MRKAAGWISPSLVWRHKANKHEYPLPPVMGSLKEFPWLTFLRRGGRAAFQPDTAFHGCMAYHGRHPDQGLFFQAGFPWPKVK